MLTRTQHLEMAACLRAAKQYLAPTACGGNTYMICHAVGMTNCHYRTKQQVKTWIERQLGPSMTLGDWLRRAHPELRTDELADANYREWRNKLQAARHAWVDHMIHILES